MTKEEIEVKMDNSEEVEVNVKEFIRQFRKEHPVKFWSIVTGLILTGTASIAGIAYLLYRKFGPKGTDEENEFEENSYEDKTDEESEAEEN